LAKQALTRGGSRSGYANGVIVPRRTVDVFIIEGRNLISNGANKVCSPYVRLKFGANKKNRTQVRTFKKIEFIFILNYFLDDQINNESSMA